MDILLDQAEALLRLADMTSPTTDPAIISDLVGSVDEVQQIVVTGSPTSGGFTLDFDGHEAVIAHNSNAAAAETALEALANILAGNVACYGGPLPVSPIFVRFAGALSRQNVPTMSVVANSLTGGTDPEATVETIIEGAEGVAGVTLLSILEWFRYASVWESATDYPYNAIVIPATRNGHRYRCVTPGTSGATEPTWPTGIENRWNDGTVVWIEGGPECDLWEMRAAASYCWNKKANLIAERFDYSDQSKSLKRDQLYRHCVERAAYYSPTIIA